MQEQQQRHRRRHHRRRRRFRFTGLYALISAVLLIGAIVGGCIVFFRVDTVIVTGNVRYTEEEIVAVSGIETGENMFLFNKYDVINQLLTELSYVEEVSVRRDMPSTILITVAECTAAAAVQDSATGSWWLVSSAGKLLERVSSAAGYLAVTGLTLEEPEAGESLAVSEDQRLQRQALVELLEALESRELLADAQSLDLSSTSIVTMEYGGRLTVKMKLSADYDYEVRVLQTVVEEYINESWDSTDTGTLDRTVDDDLTHLIRDAS